MIEGKRFFTVWAGSVLLSVMVAARIVMPGTDSKPVLAQGNPTPVRAFEVPDWTL